MEVPDATDACDAVLSTLGEAVVAERSFFEEILVGLLARGHVLLEDVPGTGKTLTARTFSTALGLSFSRVQFTPDLLPSDVTGTNVFDESDRSFRFSEGPIFANVVLADEINRAPPKTQSALLEAMEEGQVTVEGDTHDLPNPFFVIATQNPVEQEGTFQLPEAQLDRFAVKSEIGYPDLDGERELLFRRLGRSTRSPTVEAVLDHESVRDLRQVSESIRVEDDLVDYTARLARATRADRRVDVGVSPRGTQRLLEIARARAVIEGREYLAPRDVKTVAEPVLAHRLVLTPDAQVENVSKRDIVADALDEVSVPTVE